MRNKVRGVSEETKENRWYKARMYAAEREPKFKSREYAAEQINKHVPCEWHTLDKLETGRYKHPPHETNQKCLHFILPTPHCS